MTETPLRSPGSHFKHVLPALSFFCAAGVAAAVGPTPDPPGDVRGHAEALAACAAYFFNASNARPMAEYEAYFAAGERSRNRARRHLEAAEIDQIMAEAATAMTAMTGGDWRAFARVDAHWAQGCQALDRDPWPASKSPVVD